MHPQSIDLGLGRLAQVLDRLHWTQPTVPVITIAGTNGKGSVAAYCAAILGAAGLKVGTFTSPHLRDYRERIRVQESWASAETLIWAFERIENACTGAGAAGAGEAGGPTAGVGAADGSTAGVPRGNISLTFFEYNALAAMLIFEAAKLDAWVLEIGMGGRLDAVNVIDPAVAVVVSIGLDHQEFLGSTLEDIAREKAGIFRRGVPAVLGSRDMPDVLGRTALELGAPLKRLGREYDYGLRAGRWHYRGVRWNLPELPPPALRGETQYRNAAAALAALEALSPAIDAAPEAIARGLTSARLVARFQVIETAGPTFILDVAHNPAAAAVLAENLRSMPSAGRTLAVCGILGDKDAAGVAAALADCIDEWWLASTEGARGTSGTELAARMSGSLGTTLTHAVDGVAAALSAAAAAAGHPDRIVIFGSFHTVGPAMDWLEARGVLPRESPREYTPPR
ncbi:MAG TPA: folylpolyglutamate synthase/dihydrofolate synthase family protein [Steroidobacteraceae bacterium]|nr:folylpolyglutamate synthase/dihydrofolate synthase family protein [Steroidobacteraceae bacterium]